MTGTSGQYGSEETTGGRSFLQRRVALFGLISGCVFLFGLLCRTAIALIADTRSLSDPSFLFHFLGAVVFIALWAFCRGAPRTRKFVRRLEAACLVIACGAIAAMGVYIPHQYHPEMVVTIALTQGLVARAIFVPSSHKRTLALNAVIGVLLIASVYITWRSVPTVYARALRGAWGLEVALPFSKSLITAFWWSLTTIVCTASSHVIYGLRAKVQQAKQLGQYTLEEKLGEGAMGMVYRAHHGMLRRPTAVKLLLPDKLGEQSLARFEREVQLTARLTHPHTVTIFDYGRTPDGVFYYAMELLEGAALDKIIEVDGPQPAERVAYIMDQVAAALGEAHGVGLIHRDIKPANIILTQQGGEPDVAKVVDFGLVKDIQGDSSSPELSLTGEGVAGTPLYMSPETITAYQQIDARSDIYSLGAVCYFMLTGTNVFEAETAAQVCTKHLYEDPEPPSARLGEALPYDMEALILACLEKEPSKRPQSAQHIRARLWAGGTLNEWNTDRARRWWRANGDAARSAGKPGAEAVKGAARTIAIDFDKLFVGQ